MSNKRNGRVKNCVRTCTQTDCLKKDCPNYVPRIKHDSIAFTSCMYHPNFKSFNHSPNIGLTGVAHV